MKVSESLGKLRSGSLLLSPTSSTRGNMTLDRPPLVLVVTEVLFVRFAGDMGQVMGHVSITFYSAYYRGMMTRTDEALSDWEVLIP